MKEGLLWYDDHPDRSLEDAVTRAAQQYQQKHGRWPNTCHVNPADQDGPTFVVMGEHSVKVLPAINCLRSHYWIGEAETPKDNEDESK
jgi:hypothetical protein